jgi:hypothetical protein
MLHGERTGFAAFIGSRGAPAIDQVDQVVGIGLDLRAAP